MVVHDFGNPEGAANAYDKGEKLMLVPLGSFILNVIPTTGRGTYKLFYFDPGSAEPAIRLPRHTISDPARSKRSNSATS